jgi:hypothetical protein
VNEPEKLSSHVWYFVSMGRMHTDGTILVPGTWQNGEHTGGGVTIVEPDESHYELWQWLLANSELFPEVNPENATTVLQAFQQWQAEELERKVTADHGLPDSRT